MIMTTSSTFRETVDRLEDYSTEELRQWAINLSAKMAQTSASSWDTSRLSAILVEIGERCLVKLPKETNVR